MATAATPLVRVRSEWAANPRLRWGVMAALAIAFVYAALALNDWRLALHRQYEQATLRLYKVAALNGKTEWTQRGQDAAAMRKALEAQVPSVASVGLAQADMQGWAREVTGTFGKDLATSSQPATRVGNGDVWKVPVTIRGSIEPGLAIGLLRRVEASERLIVVEALQLNNRQRPMMTITVSGHYRLPPQPAAGSRDG